ncbi:hypothetical protein BLNAU_3630 [Blattamonas nauphoetae]|uniref:Saposin B-type domain-containing protein n=1 Tax=Blattamonas nauphoetae TaxID=2049346 RepID=A0ABQ9YCU1_9EUKA|nr:hypothetical protein BLNAU_3630 [Blattamonas nauphoetae]
MTQARHKEGSSHSYSTTEETDLQSNDACQNCVSLVKKIVDFVEKYGIQKLKEVMTQERVCPSEDADVAEFIELLTLIQAEFE